MNDNHCPSIIDQHSSHMKRRSIPFLQADNHPPILPSSTYILMLLARLPHPQASQMHLPFLSLSPSPLPIYPPSPNQIATNNHPSSPLRSCAQNAPLQTRNAHTASKSFCSPIPLTRSSPRSLRPPPPPPPPRPTTTPPTPKNTKHDQKKKKRKS